MSFYKVLDKQTFTSGSYSLVPIRIEDRFDIMKWRNEQLYHLRQNKPLEKEDQNLYFNNVVSKLFEQKEPKQKLFSYLEDNKCIGYGGLVHINWIDKNAEISFIMDTALEANCFDQHWVTFLNLIEKVAFHDLNFHKIYVYAFDVRPNLYKALETGSFFRDAVLKEHCSFQRKFIDVIIYSKIFQV